MAKNLITMLVALAIIGGIATSVSAHRPSPQPTVAEKAWPPKDFWDKQNGR